jgi:signal transduction histidine kinase
VEVTDNGKGIDKKDSEMYQPSIDAKKLRLVIQSPTTLFLNIDIPKIKQAVSNLISNAVKFTEEGEIKISVLEKNSQALVEVTDNGKGIDKKDLKRVFERFFQAKPNMKGTGIGLTIAKAWVEAHGGKIWAESEGEGRGTKLSFTLPLN